MAKKGQKFEKHTAELKAEILQKYLEGIIILSARKIYIGTWAFNGCTLRCRNGCTCCLGEKKLTL